MTRSEHLKFIIVSSVTFINTVGGVLLRSHDLEI